MPSSSVGAGGEVPLLVGPAGAVPQLQPGAVGRLTVRHIQAFPARSVDDCATGRVAVGDLVGNLPHLARIPISFVLPVAELMKRLPTGSSMPLVSPPPLANAPQETLKFVVDRTVPSGPGARSSSADAAACVKGRIPADRIATVAILDQRDRFIVVPLDLKLMWVDAVGPQGRTRLIDSYFLLSLPSSRTTSAISDKPTNTRESRQVRPGASIAANAGRGCPPNRPHTGLTEVSPDRGTTASRPDAPDILGHYGDQSKSDHPRGNEHPRCPSPPPTAHRLKAVTYRCKRRHRHECCSQEDAMGRTLVNDLEALYRRRCGRC